MTPGISHVDGYIFPCTTSSCAAPATQISEASKALKNAGATVGMLWLDIETYNWPSDHTKNREFIEAMGKELTVSYSLKK
ncbi:hypothetical protein OESDEN_12060 [Oesophagostomum dentatum]|uniref:Uncharacterized protein n=1 Tax=Oesophagostomum dentatum TaxID=61180 RepID=A0A0B1STA5_OESDE|nr:hypothetical protein OESDEN_12060 [Oesophagostomum dentatum]